MELAGFIYSDVLTQLFRKLAQHFSKGGGEAQHIVYTSHVYINPKVILALCLGVEGTI